MKATGMIRPIDNLGRIVIPNELRNTFNLNPKDYVEIFTDENTIILKKYVQSCIFCGGVDNIQYFEGKKVCDKCMSKLASMAKHQ